MKPQGNGNQRKRGEAAGNHRMGGLSGGSTPKQPVQPNQRGATRPRASLNSADPPKTPKRPPLLFSSQPNQARTRSAASKPASAAPQKRVAQSIAADKPARPSALGKKARLTSPSPKQSSASRAPSETRSGSLSREPLGQTDRPSILARAATQKRAGIGVKKGLHSTGPLKAGSTPGRSSAMSSKPNASSIVSKPPVHNEIQSPLSGEDEAFSTVSLKDLVAGKDTVSEHPKPATSEPTEESGVVALRELAPSKDSRDDKGTGPVNGKARASVESARTRTATNRAPSTVPLFSRETPEAMFQGALPPGSPPVSVANEPTTHRLPDPGAATDDGEAFDAFSPFGRSRRKPARMTAAVVLVLAGGVAAYAAVSTMGETADDGDVGNEILVSDLTLKKKAASVAGSTRTTTPHTARQMKTASALETASHRTSAPLSAETGETATPTAEGTPEVPVVESESAVTRAVSRKRRVRSARPKPRRGSRVADVAATADEDTARNDRSEAKIAGGDDGIAPTPPSISAATPTPSDDPTLVKDTPVDKEKEVKALTAILDGTDVSAKKIPIGLSKAAVQRGMSKIRSQVAQCAEDDGRQIFVSVTIDKTGRVSRAVATGEHAGTEVGRCVTRIVRTASFPQSIKETTVKYPFQL